MSQWHRIKVVGFYLMLNCSMVTYRHAFLGHSFSSLFLGRFYYESKKKTERIILGLGACPAGLQVRQHLDGGVRPDPRDRNLHSSPATNTSGRISSLFKSAVITGYKLETASTPLPNSKNDLKIHLFQRLYFWIRAIPHKKLATSGGETFSWPD